MCPLHISSTSDNSHFSANSVNDDRRVKLQRCFGERGPMPRQRPSVSLPGQQSYPLPRAWRERAMAGISPLKKKKSPHFWVVFPPLLLDCLWPRCRWASSHTTQHITPRTRWTARTGEGIWWFLDYDSTLKVLFKSFKSVYLWPHLLHFTLAGQTQRPWPHTGTIWGVIILRRGGVLWENCISCFFRNPGGRTGIRGRGALSRLGPNRNVELVLTRYLNVQT